MLREDLTNLLKKLSVHQRSGGNTESSNLWDLLVCSLFFLACISRADFAADLVEFRKSITWRLRISARPMGIFTSLSHDMRRCLRLGKDPPEAFQETKFALTMHNTCRRGKPPP